MTGIWQALARLIAYPDGRTAADVRAMLPALQGTQAGTAGIAGFLEATAGMTLPELQEQYSAAFDFDPACALDVGWHLFGESRERGAFLSALREDLQHADIPESPELPDHLTHVIALVSRDEYTRAAQLADLVMPAVADIERALTRRGSPYAHALAGVYAEFAAVLKRVAGSEDPALRVNRVAGSEDPALQHSDPHPRRPGSSDPGFSGRPGSSDPGK